MSSGPKGAYGPLSAPVMFFAIAFIIGGIALKGLLGGFNGNPIPLKANCIQATKLACDR